MITWMKRHPLITFFFLAYAFTWQRWVAEALNSRGLADLPIPFGSVLLAGYGPALAALIVIAITQGRAGLKDFGARLARWRVGLRWYLAVFLLPLLPALASVIGMIMIGQAVGDLSTLPDATVYLMYFGMFMVGFDAFGEELGWRGYAQPKLQAARSLLVTVLLMGLLWTFWHLPFYLTVGSFMSHSPLLLHLLYILALTVIHVWINTNTRQSTLLSVIFHAANNATSMFLLSWNPVFNGTQAFLIAVVVMWVVAISIILFAHPFRLTAKKPAAGEPVAAPQA